MTPPPQVPKLVRNKTRDEGCGDGIFFLQYDGAPAPADPSDPCTQTCVNPVSTFVCNTLNNKKKYQIKVLVGCYCKAALQAAMVR